MWRQQDSKIINRGINKLQQLQQFEKKLCQLNEIKINQQISSCLNKSINIIKLFCEEKTTIKERMKQEKSIEDYRRDIKLLKLKYLKLQEEKQRLEQTVQRMAMQQQGSPVEDEVAIIDKGCNASPSVQGSPSKNSQNYMSYDKNAMREFQLKCKQNLGMTPESLFRASDVEGTGVVSDHQLKSFLQQTKLNLNSQHIQRIVQLSDVNCTGMIKKEQFFECLAAFQINMEVTSQTDKSGNRTYVQKSLFKFANNIIKLKISPHDCFTQMDTTGDNVISYDDMNSFVSRYCKDMNETECIGAFNYLDIDKEQRIGRDMFVVEVKKVMRVVAKECNLNVNDFIDNKSIQPRKAQETGQKIARPLIPQVLEQKQEENEQAFASSVGEISTKQLTDKEVLEVLQKLQAYKADLYLVLQTLMENSKNPNSGLFLVDIFGVFDKLKLGRKVPNELKVRFFRCVDQGGNGSIDYEELIAFFVERKDPKQPIEFVYSLVAHTLQSLQIKAPEAFTFLGITENTVLDSKSFPLVADKIFGVKKPDQALKLLKEISGNKGQILAETLITEIDRELEILLGRDPLNQSSILKLSGSQRKIGSGKLSGKQTFKDLKNSMMQKGDDKSFASLRKINTKAMSFIETDIDEYERIMDEIYPNFDQEKDFFERVKKNDDGELLFTKWKTIMNDELPTLRTVLEIVKELKDGESWSDPEFGPCEKDPFGSKAMYFSDNDVPTGCPPPENVQWMRIGDYLDNYIKNNQDEATTFQEIEEPHFLMSGASSNDVKQSSYLGDCWFVSALSIIAQYDNYLVGSYDPTKKGVDPDLFLIQMSEGIYPPMFHFLQKYGIFVLKFYKNFAWRYVIIDDKLPCLDGNIIYSHSRTPNEFWVSLIEKAYAKLHNCYQALTSGDIGQGLTDLTGQVSMKLKFDSVKVTKAQIEGGDFDKVGVLIDGVRVPCSEDTYEEVYEKVVAERDEVWDDLKKYLEKGSLMGCSADGGTESAVTYNDEKAGIYSGHAYSLITVFELAYLDGEKSKHEGNRHQNHRLLCLRNPWGYGEWLLKWSETEDVDSRILDMYKTQIDQYYNNQIEQAKRAGKELPEKYVPGTDDGMFLMCFKDWRSIFSNLFLCLKFDPKQWVGYEIEDKWSAGFCSGTVKKGEPSITNFAAKNPQFTFRMKKGQAKKVKAFINLVQDDGRLYAGEKYPYENVQQSLLLCLFVLGEGTTKLEKFDQKIMCASSGKFNLRREVDFGKLIVVEPQKTYCIVPCTLKGEVEGEAFKDIDFSINFYFNNCPASDMEILKANGPGKLSKEIVNVSTVDPQMAQHSMKLKQFLKQSVESVIHDEC